MIKKYKLLMFIVFLESLISFSSATIVYVAVTANDEGTGGLKICGFNDKNGALKKCNSPDHFQLDEIISIGVNPVNHNAYFTFSGSQLLYTCSTNHANGDIRDCSSINIADGGGNLGGMAFSSNGRLLYLADREKNSIRVCHLNESGSPINGCPIMTNIYKGHPDSHFSSPVGITLDPNNLRLLVADTDKSLMLSCALVGDNYFGNCTPLENRFYGIPNDVVVNQYLPNHVFIASGHKDKPVVVCHTPDYVNFTHCFGYPVQHVSDNINSIKAITISSNGHYAFVANESTVVTKKIQIEENDGEQLINTKVAKFEGRVNAIAAYN